MVLGPSGCIQLGGGDTVSGYEGKQLRHLQSLLYPHLVCVCGGWLWGRVMDVVRGRGYPLALGPQN